MAEKSDIVPVVGFQIKKIEVTAGRGEEDVGTMKVTLEASKDELRAQDRDISDILGAMNMHSSTKEAVAVQLRF